MAQLYKPFIQAVISWVSFEEAVAKEPPIAIALSASAFFPTATSSNTPGCFAVELAMETACGPEVLGSAFLGRQPFQPLAEITIVVAPHPGCVMRTVTAVNRLAKAALPKAMLAYEFGDVLFIHDLMSLSRLGSRNRRRFKRCHPRETYRRSANSC
jgi:hypothetical protein